MPRSRAGASAIGAFCAATASASYLFDALSRPLQVTLPDSNRIRLSYGTINDAVTGGGYATSGTVISVERDRMAQARTGSKVQFERVDIDGAVAARSERRARLEKARAAVAGA